MLPVCCASCGSSRLEVGRGTIAAAKAHIESVIARLKLVDQQIEQAHTRLDELCAEILANDDSDEREEAA